MQTARKYYFYMLNFLLLESYCMATFDLKNVCILHYFIVSGRLLVGEF